MTQEKRARAKILKAMRSYAPREVTAAQVSKLAGYQVKTTAYFLGLMAEEGIVTCIPVNNRRYLYLWRLNE